MNKKFLLCVMVLSACRTAPKTEVVFNTPPASTAEACAAIRHWFETHRRYSVAPRNVTRECQMRITAEVWRSSQLMQHLEKTGWKRDPNYSRGAAPNAFAWETPTTRCTIEQLRSLDGGDDRLRPRVGVSGGSGVSPAYGIGIGIGSSQDALIDYKIHCQDKG